MLKCSDSKSSVGGGAFIYSNGFSAFSWWPLMNQINATGVTADVQNKMLHMLRNFTRCKGLRISWLDLYTGI